MILEKNVRGYDWAKCTNKCVTGDFFIDDNDNDSINIVKIKKDNFNSYISNKMEDREWTKMSHSQQYNVWLAWKWGTIDSFGASNCEVTRKQLLDMVIPSLHSNKISAQEKEYWSMIMEYERYAKDQARRNGLVL